MGVTNGKIEGIFFELFEKWDWIDIEYNGFKFYKLFL